MSFKKTASSLQEIELQKIAASYGFAPKVLSSDGLDFEMVKIYSPCLADVYGENPNDLPRWIWNEIIHILAILYEAEGIEYIDITPYNFIESNGFLWIIDFGHAFYTESPVIPSNWFLRGLLETEERSWNPDFK